MSPGSTPTNQTPRRRSPSCRTWKRCITMGCPSSGSRHSGEPIGMDKATMLALMAATIFGAPRANEGQKSIEARMDEAVALAERIWKRALAAEDA